MNTSNRRAYVRFDDDVMLGLRVLDESADQASVQAEFARLSDERAASEAEGQGAERARKASAIDEIRRTAPDVAAYLGYLEQRIDALSSELARSRPLEMDALEARRINLSAQGLRTENREQLEAGQLAAVSLVLLPRGERVVAIGTVVRTEPDSEAGPAWAAIEFTHLSENDRDTIVRRGHRLQRETLARRHQERPAD